MSTLVILIGNTLDAPWVWGMVNSDKSGYAATSEDKADLTHINATKICAVIPGALVSTKIHAPENLTAKQWRQAAGFSIEDSLASSLDNTHIAYDFDTQRLAVIANDDMVVILDTLAKVGIMPDIMCADYDAFEDTLSFVYDGKLIERSANGLGYSVEISLAPRFLDAGQNLPTEISGATFAERIGMALQSGHKPLNLLQGEFANQARAGAGLGQFKRSALLAAALALAFLTVNLGTGYNYARKTAKLNAEAKAIYAKLFPNTAIPDNPALAVIRAQSAGRTDQGEVFIQISTVLAISTKQVKGVEISSLRYDKSKGELNLSILYDSFEDVERLKQAVAKNGGVFTEGGTRQNGDKLSGDAILGAGS